MSKQSDDFRASLASLFDGQGKRSKHEGTSKPSDTNQQDTTVERGAQVEEAEAWLENSVRDENADSERGFDFLDDEDQDVPPPDEWPAFEDIDADNVVIRYGASETDNDASGVGTEDETTDDVIATLSGKSAHDIPVRKRSMKNTLGRFSRRLVGALAVLALAGGAAYGIMRGHTQSQQVSAPAFQGAPVSTQLACAGTFERSLEVGMSAEDIDERISDIALLLSTGDGSIGDKHVRAPAGSAPPAGDPVDKSDNSSEITALGILSLPQALGIFSADNYSTSLAGLNSHRADAGDMRGLASVACVGGQVDSYLIGSQMSVGTSNDLVLVNLSSAPTTVHLEALGSSGFLEASSVENIVVDARAVKRVSLDGAIDGDERLALHISAPTGAVAAFMQETALEGAKPAGVSWISPTSASKNLVIPALSIPLDSVDFPRVRIANFEDKPATVSLTLRSEQGELAREELQSVEVAAHSVLDIPLDGIDGGMYSAIITSDIPVSAGVELAHRQSEDAPREIAWASALNPVYESMAAVEGASATLVFAGEENGTATISFYDKAGARIDTQTVEMSGTRSSVVNMQSEAVAVRLSADVPVAGAVFAQTPLDQGMGIDWIPLVSRADDVGSQRIAVW